MQVRILFHNPYDDIVVGGEVNKFTSKLQTDLAAMLKVDPSRFANFQVSSGMLFDNLSLRPFNLFLEK